MMSWPLGVAARFTLALATSLMVVLSLPKPDQGWIAWGALVPLMLACRGLSYAYSFAIGLVSGVTTTLGVFYWVLEVPGFHFYHMLLGAFYFSLYPALWCAGISLLKNCPIPFVIIAPSLWVGLDYLKAHAGFLSLPWATLAHTQHGNIPLIQIASFTGEYGVTFVVVIGSIVLTDAIVYRKWRSVALGITVIACLHILGIVALSNMVKGWEVKVAVVQPSLLLSERKAPSGHEVAITRLEQLTRVAAQSYPSVIIWPETAVREFKANPILLQRIQELVADVQTPIVAGASEHHKFSRAEEGILHLGTQSFNSAYFITPEGPVQMPYRKMILVPFAEYIPITGHVKWPGWFVSRSFEITPGDSLRYFTLADGVRIGPIICWENLFSGHVRALVREGAQMVVQLTNDNWFGRTAAPFQHNIPSVFRAVENRIPFVIASNTGPSQIIDPFGRIVAEIAQLFQEGVLVAEVNPRAGESFYTRHGDVFAFISIAILAAAGMVSAFLAFPPRRERRIVSRKRFSSEGVAAK